MYKVSKTIVRDSPDARPKSSTNNNLDFPQPQKTSRQDPNTYSRVKQGLARTGIYARGYIPGSQRINNSIFRAPISAVEQTERKIMNYDMRRVIAKNISGASTKNSEELSKKAIKYGRHIIHNEEKLEEKHLSASYGPLAESVLNPEEEKEAKEVVDETLLILKKPIGRNTFFPAIPDQTAYTNILANRYGIDKSLLTRASTAPAMGKIDKK